MLASDGPFRPFKQEQFQFLGGDAFMYLQKWQLGLSCGMVLGFVVLGSLLREVCRSNLNIKLIILLSLPKSWKWWESLVIIFFTNSPEFLTLNATAYRYFAILTNEIRGLIIS